MKASIVIPNKTSFFTSALNKTNQFQTIDLFHKWFIEKSKKNFCVTEIPFNKLEKWSFTPNNESIEHESGKFFKIEGISVKTNFGNIESWDQPIINQPEIGILGIITKIFKGNRYFLMQVKMEPGNINVIQLSPTVQATKSNFSRVHEGKLPSYLEYFLDITKSKILFDQLQTEQGARFLRKRNRNIVIEVSENIELLDDFCWLTLGEIKQLLKIPNFVNMDARSVISIIPLIDDEVLQYFQNINFKTVKSIIINEKIFRGFGLSLLSSASNQTNCLLSKDQIISWFTMMKIKFELITEKKPLSELANWKISDSRIFNENRFFSVIAVKVHAGTREVNSWTQPLIKDLNIGLIGFIVKLFHNIPHFLVQAKVEVGHTDIIELSPTISCSNYYYRLNNFESQPNFFKYFVDDNSIRVLYNTIQSEEGGRFYHLQNINKIVLISDKEQLNIPQNFCWMSLSQIMEFMRYGMFNIEARSLISSLNFDIE